MDRDAGRNLVGVTVQRDGTLREGDHHRQQLVRRGALPPASQRQSGTLLAVGRPDRRKGLAGSAATGAVRAETMALRARQRLPPCSADKLRLATRRRTPVELGRVRLL